MKYRVLFTDVGNVIAPFFLDRFTHNLSGLTGLPVEQVDALLYREMSGGFTSLSQGCQGIHRGILTGHISSEEYFAEIQSRFGCELHPSLFWHSFRNVFDPNRRLVGLWNSLRFSGRIERIILLSDADPKRLSRALEITDFEPDAAAVSYEVGQLKPHPDMYRRALELAKAPPETCIFVDDVAENVQAAREFGIESFLYQYPKLGLDEATDILVGELERVGFFS